VLLTLRPTPPPRQGRARASCEGWAYLKGGPLANACPNDVADLEGSVVVAAESARTHQALLRAFVRGTKLPFRFK